MSNNSVSYYALKDISKYITNIPYYKTGYDVWYVTAFHLKNKETRRLNRALGIHKLNKLIPHNKKCRKY